MCTVTFLPYKKKGYILTSNRDEQLTRPLAGLPEVTSDKKYRLVFARDPVGGGTWIASDDRGNSVCLLNGAFGPHEPRYPYKHSRGLVVINFFKYKGIDDFTENYNLDRIEPFTLVIVWNEKLYELKWDGEITYSSQLPYNEPNIWSSVTLYSKEVIDKRKQWFHEWLGAHPGYMRDDIISFHTFGGEGDARTNIMMEHNNKLKTFSITSVLYHNDQISFRYKDLLKNMVLEHFMYCR